jgi:hypothetical protein
MIYRKLICFLTFLLMSNIVFGQIKKLKKLEQGFIVGLCYNSVTSTNSVDISGIIRTPIEFERTWQLQNQPSMTIGFALKNKLTQKVATQLEFNLLSTRQKATIDEAKSFNNNKTATSGNIQFSSLFLHIPVIMSFKIEEASEIEIGVFGVFLLQNWSQQSLTKTVFSEQKETLFSTNSNPILTFSPPKIVVLNNRPLVSNNIFGALIGVNYRINEKISVRLRYEAEFENFSDYGDLYQSRLSIGFLFKVNKLPIFKKILRGLL